MMQPERKQTETALIDAVTDATLESLCIPRKLRKQ